MPFDLNEDLHTTRSPTTELQTGQRRLLLLCSIDNVCIATTAVESGARLEIDTQTLIVKQDIPLGFKIAVRDIAKDEKILKYGVSIGSATRDIVQGELVHVDNMKSDYLPTYTLGEGHRYDY
jgi:altronate dehydratase small subunit